MNNLDKQYKELLETILYYGVDKEDRTGTGTQSIFGYTIRHNMQDGFPLLTTKKVAFQTMATELRWFLRGHTNIRELLFNDCNIWVGDAYKQYLSNYPTGFEKEGAPAFTKKEFIEKVKEDFSFSVLHAELGPIYGKQWRDWSVRNDGSYDESIDQISNLIHELKTNPDSRRLMVNAWNVGELDKMTLPPCHYGFQCYTTEMTFGERALYWTSSIGKDVSYAAKLDESDLDEKNVPKRKLSLMWNQRSVDVFLGLPFNIASYGLLLSLLAKEVNMMPDQLIGSLGDTHLYNNHIEQAKQQLRNEPKQLPTLELDCMECDFDILDGLFGALLKGYKPHPAIKAPLSN
tara:strand:- start:47 stop:1084 length:1038 start_codon:yes stop_codon:yes gene_type:complete